LVASIIAVVEGANAYFRTRSGVETRFAGTIGISPMAVPIISAPGNWQAGKLACNYLLFQHQQPFSD
jgi:hypothetical protein